MLSSFILIVAKNPFIPDTSAPNKTSPEVATELFTKLAKYLFSFLLKLFTKILACKACKSANDVVALVIGNDTSPELAFTP